MTDKTKLPKYVSVNGDKYRYREYMGVLDGRVKFGPSIVLATTDAPMSEVWAAYEGLTAEAPETVGWMLSKYEQSDKFKSLSPKSQEDYSKSISKLREARAGTIRLADAKLSRVSKRSIRSFLDTYPSPIAANRHIAVLKAAWNWALQRYDIPDNACQGVELNKEAPRERYVTDDEYITVLNLAPKELRQYMELAYLLRARLSEVRALTVDDVSDTHVRLNRLKGSEGELTVISDRLRKALKVSGGNHIVHQYTESGFRSAWRRLQARMKEAGVPPFPFHDLKARGVTDHERNWAGHRSASLRKTYVRKLQEMPATR